MAKNKKQDIDGNSALPVGLGGVIMLIGGILLLCSAITFSPTDLPMGPMKFLKDFAPAVEPTLPRNNMFGPFGTLVGFLQLQLLGAASFFLSVGLILLGALRIVYKRRETLMMRIGYAGAIVCIAGFMACPGVGLSGWASYNVLTSPGGIVGQLLGDFIFKNLLSTVGATIIFLVGYFVSLCYFCGGHPMQVIYRFIDLIKAGFAKLGNKTATLSSQRGSKSAVRERIPPLPTSLFDDKELEPVKKPKAKPKPKPEPIITEPIVDSAPIRAEEPQIIDGTTKRFTAEEVLKVKPFEKKEGGYQGLTVDGFEGYELPGFDLLDYDDSEPESDTNRDELFATQRTIIETLKSFNLEVTPGDITRGPTITRFEVYPAIGLKVSRITALEADLARVTKAEAINILAPIPGKDTVGIEVANDNRILVPFSEILMDDAFRSSKRKIPLALGKNVYGESVIGDLAAMPHCLIAGATGAGKSVCINTVICSILYKFSPEELRFIMVDPKVVEMQVYSRLPHLVVPVITDPAKVVGALKWSVNEMERRYKLFAKCGVRNFDSFNNRERPEAEVKEAEEIPEEIDEPVDMEQIDAIAKAFEDGDLGPEAEVDEDLAGFPEEEDEDEIPDRLPYIVIIIDELADLMQTAPADVELCIARIAQKARAAGMHLIVATQTPRADVVTGIIKANIPSRISFQVSSKIDSRVILDQGGAEKLIGKGDMLFLPPGSAKLERSQGAFVSDEEVDQIVEFCSDQAEQKFEESIQNSINAGGDLDGAPDEDVNAADEELLKQCLEVVIQEGKASTSLLQRRLRLGYTRAARIVDLMEQRGYVGPADGARPREVFVGN